jgi:glycosyltransferase involved in cell wall biosynthesis
MNISAVILSSRPVTLTIPGVTVVSHVSRFRDTKGLLAARMASLRKVQTEWFFWLDDDDELPDNYLDVLARCVDQPHPLAYTDELITSTDGSSRVRKSAPYSEDAFITDNTLVHHLAVCKTEVAQRIAPTLPVGYYSAEMLLFFQVAKAGATYVPEVGYVWHRREHGLNRHPTTLLGLTQSAIRAARDRSPAPRKRKTKT